MKLPSHYVAASRHPWPSAVLVLLLLTVYEAGLWWQTQAGRPVARTGLDSWLAQALQQASWHYPLMPPLVITGTVLFWLALAWRKPAPPLGTTCMGMLLEGVVWALLLWGLGSVLLPVFHRASTAAVVSEPRNLSLAAWCVTFLGAGVYEETVFRLVLFGLLLRFGRSALGPGGAGVLAAAVSVTLFAAAHHYGPAGEPWSPPLFAFRVTAGLLFTLLFHFRGFGVAVACHACYDVLVGLVARP
jgi:membrane protease YdiL (CAAX protease family)